jgi:hypothetical protein
MAPTHSTLKTGGLIASPGAMRLPRIIAPITTAAMVLTLVTPTSANAITNGFYAKRNRIATATPTMSKQDMKPIAGC